MGLKAFLRENARLPENRRVVISDRFLDEEGKPEHWELRAISEQENNRIRESCTVKTMKRGRQQSEFNGSLYTQRLNTACVVYPDLMDSALQENYGVVGAEQLLAAMLLPGEYGTLSEQVADINHFDMEEAKEEVKNS